MILRLPRHSLSTFILMPMVALLGVVMLPTVGVEAQSNSLAEQYPPRLDQMRPTSGMATEFRPGTDVTAHKRVPLQVDWADNDLTVGKRLTHSDALEAELCRSVARSQKS